MSQLSLIPEASPRAVFSPCTKHSRWVDDVQLIHDRCELDCARRLGALVGHELPGQLVKAGRRLDLHPVPSSVAQSRARAEAP